MSEITGFTADSGAALPLYVLDREQFAAWKDGQPAATRAWLASQGFSAGAHSVALLPGADGLAGAVVGVGDRADAYSYAHARTHCPKAACGSWPTNCRPPNRHCCSWAGAWAATASTAIASATVHRHSWWRHRPGSGRPDRCQPARARLGQYPDRRHGPAAAGRRRACLAAAHGAQVEAITGDELLKQNFPAIHAVGRASHRAPRLVVLRWGKDTDPALVLVGKGVCFDTGGLDIKPADGMRNMKKDMGGAAHALALAGLVMARGLPVRLTLLVPAVENAIGPDAFRPGEVIATRKGLSVEIDNTDAEGRVILCDALTFASEQKPDLVLDFATLTGAARIALGPTCRRSSAMTTAWPSSGAGRRRHP